MAFDESKISRDEKGRFSSTGGGQLPSKTTSGQLSGWASRGLPFDTSKGNPKGTWDAAKAKWGPLAGKISSARYGQEQQKDLFQKGDPNLNVGTHFMKQSVADPFGHTLEHAEDDETVKRENTDQHKRDSLESLDNFEQAKKDIAKQFPNVAAYLKKNPLTEVQTRRAMAEWMLAKDRNNVVVDKGYHFQPIGGLYVHREGKWGDDPDADAVGITHPEEHAGGQKRGDLVAMLTRDAPGHEELGRPIVHADKSNKITPSEEKRWLLPLNQQPGDASGQAPSTISLSASNMRDYSLATVLHEIGHHVMLGDKENEPSRRKISKDQLRLPGTSNKLESSWPEYKTSKVEKIRKLIEKGYRKDYNRAVETNSQPFTSYASVSPAEWFAEAFTAFHVRPDYLKQASPSAYKTVKRVLKVRGIAQPDSVRLGAPPLFHWANSKRKSAKEL